VQSFQVAGAIIEREGQLLLVRNRRRNGDHDWTTPGGVVDAGESVLEGLAREVREETGLLVRTWSTALYRVRVEFPEREWVMDVTAHMAIQWEGAIELEDPDGIVVEAGFCAADLAATRLQESPRWVSEPLIDWTTRRPEVEESFSYSVTTGSDGLVVLRE
jgi:8-oxo-dGTP diphosphatase